MILAEMYFFSDSIFDFIFNFHGHLTRGSCVVSSGVVDRGAGRADVLES